MLIFALMNCVRVFWQNFNSGTLLFTQLSMNETIGEAGMFPDDSSLFAAE
jgi:hypothetical protein